MKYDPCQVHEQIRKGPGDDKPAKKLHGKRPLLFADADTEQPEEQFEDAEGNSDGQGLEGRGLEKLSSIS